MPTTTPDTDEPEVRPLPDAHRVRLTSEDSARRERGLTIACPAATCRAPAGQPCRYRDVAGIWREARLLHAIRLNAAARQQPDPAPATPATTGRRVFLARRAGRVVVVAVPAKDAAPARFSPATPAGDTPGAVQDVAGSPEQRPEAVVAPGNPTAPVPASAAAARPHLAPARNRWRAPSPLAKESL